MGGHAVRYYGIERNTVDFATEAEMVRYFDDVHYNRDTQAISSITYANRPDHIVLKRSNASLGRLGPASVTSH
jgi:hypothetical protein